MPVFLSQSAVYYNVDRLLNDLTAQQSSTTARWGSIKTTLNVCCRCRYVRFWPECIQ